MALNAHDAWLNLVRTAAGAAPESPLKEMSDSNRPGTILSHLSRFSPRLRIGQFAHVVSGHKREVWLADRSPENERAVAAGMADISGMVEVYALRHRDGAWAYERLSSRLVGQPGAFRQWAERRHAGLMASMATENAPHLVGLLADGYGFGHIGDHGGAQERVQRIPMMIRVPGENGSTRAEPLRLVDIDREVTQIMKLPAKPAHLTSIGIARVASAFPPASDRASTRSR